MKQGSQANIVPGTKSPPAIWRHCLALFAIASIAAWSLSSRFGLPASVPAHYSPPIIENQIDEALAAASKNALGQREGAIIVLDPQTGRLRAVVNPQIAFENSYAPGSTIKPFTALAALRSGIIDKDSRALCREHYARHGFSTVCAHPRDLPPLDPATAIAYSCNYYFGRLGERLSEEALGDTLSGFGFGKRTSINKGQDREGQLLRGKADPRNALGEGDYLQTTPLQLALAYSALVNDGHLFTPASAPASEFIIKEQARLSIAPEHRSLIINGMRGAVVYGTAARAGLNTASLKIFGKTGTSTPLKGFRSQGWFVGFAADSADDQPPPQHVKLEVLVFLKRGHGADAAKVSRTVFEEFARWKDQIPSNSTTIEAQQQTTQHTSFAKVRSWISELWSKSESAAAPTAAAPSPLPEPASSQSGSSAVRKVSVHLVTENITREMSLEDYVATVVATEGSMEDEPQALKALAVAVRTYALKNLGRHAKDGYDFCTTTHCQRYQAASDPTVKADDTGAPALAATRETAGEVLRDQKAALVDSYFSASCGGATANINALWGGSASPSYLRGVRDDYCTDMPHHNWTDVIAAEQLLQALRSDERTDPGTRLNTITITRHDNTGRAELIAIDGERRRVVRGWDFKIIVGRKLGWNLLKSSRFEVVRSGTNFIFRGSGFGHGLGLCQEGAHVMAQRGSNYEQILGKYFPGTSVVRELRESAARAGNSRNESPDSSGHADLIWKSINSPLSEGLPASSTGRASLSSEHFRVSYPVTLSQRDAEGILRTLEATRANLVTRVSAAGLSLDQFPASEVFINETTGDFVGRTGQPWWAAAATRDRRIELQPLPVLKRRGILELTLKHELVHTVVDKLSGGRAPRWLAEGVSLYFAGEGQLVSRYRSNSKMSVAEIDASLNKSSSPEEMRKAYAAAYREVSGLIKAVGEGGVWQRVARGS